MNKQDKQENIKIMGRNMFKEQNFQRQYNI